MVIPEKLNKGDKAALIGLASPSPEKLRINAENNIKKLGLEPVFYPSCYEAHGYMAGTVERRLKDLHDAFSDPEIKAVFSINGGYGCARLVDKIDYNMIKKNPKHFIGFSDVTVIHTAINQICGQMTIHGSMPGVKWEKSGDSIFQSTGDLLFGFPEGEFKNPPGETMTSLVDGRAEGIMCGGNLSRMVSTLGSAYEIDTRGKLLFIEEIGERAEDVDKMLMSLELSGKLRDSAGFVLGPFIDCENSESETRLTPEEIFSEILVPYGKPILKGLASGHGFPFVAFPLGARAIIDGNKLYFKK